MLRITAYADRLLKDLDLLDWPESLKEMQRNWIGRSEGAEVRFPVAAVYDRRPDADADGGHRPPPQEETITVFTTRPDTLFGATYMVLSPEHPLVDKLTTPAQREAVQKYKAGVANKSDLERTDLAKSKSGVFTGAYALNPVNNEKIPIWIADYVLMGYGTGAIMAVPAHDERDHEFAKQYDLPIVQVVSVVAAAVPSGGCLTGEKAPPLGTAAATTEPGIAINSGFLDGLPTAEAKAQMIDWLEAEGKGARRVQYKLRDWLFSRQRYWGEPFPVVWSGDRHDVISENDLPLTLPELDDYKPSPEGNAPLAKATDWVQLPDGRTRETNTMPQWAGSCWYYLRYCDPKNPDALIDPAVEKYWMGDTGVDLYIGRRGACGAAPALRALLAQGAVRHRGRFHARAVSQARESGHHPRRGQPEDVQVARKTSSLPISVIE